MCVARTHAASTLAARESTHNQRVHGFQSLRLKASKTPTVPHSLGTAITATFSHGLTTQT